MRSVVFLALASVLLSLTAVAGVEPQVFPFLVKIDTELGETSCTATLLKERRGVCRLLTNAHCFHGKLKSIALYPKADISALIRNEGFFFPNARRNRPIALGLIKINPEVDLAELSIPSGLRPYCSTLPTLTTTNDIERSIREEGFGTFISIGYHAGVARTAQSRDDFMTGLLNGRGPVGKSETSLPGLDHLYRFGWLQMLAGMSGGPTLDRQLRLVGINRRYILLQESTEIIPLPNVLLFLSGPLNREVLGKVLDGTLSGDFGQENTVPNGGENSGANGGENSGANGGENSGANGGETLPTGLRHSPLSFLREPDEGTMVDGRRLLALGTYQIDGRDDLRRLTGQGLVPLFADSAEFRQVRGELFERFLGDFRVSQRGYGESKRKTLIQSNGEWVVDLEGQVHIGGLRVERTSTGHSLKIFFSDWLGTRRTNEIRNIFAELPAKILTFQARFNADASQIILTNEQGGELTCLNRHFLKLICSSATEEFSLSQTSTGADSELVFRHSWINSGGITYEYGMLSRRGQ